MGVERREKNDGIMQKQSPLSLSGRVVIGFHWEKPKWRSSRSDIRADGGSRKCAGNSELRRNIFASGARSGKTRIMDQQPGADIMIKSIDCGGLLNRRNFTALINLL